MAAATVAISNLPNAATLTGSELVPGVQASNTINMTAGDIAALSVLFGAASETLDNTIYQAMSTSLSRTAIDALRDHISVMDFIPTSMHANIRSYTSTDDLTSYIENAIVAGVCYFPPGLFNFDSLTIADASGMRFRGAGINLTELRCIGGGNGIAITYSNTYKPPSIEDMTLSTTATSSVNVGLSITAPVSASITNMGPKVEAVRITGANTATNCWGTCLSFVNCWYPQVGRGASIKGLDQAAPPFTTAVGIQLTACQAPIFNGFTIFHCTAGIYENDSTFGEGVNFSHFEIVGVAVGIQLIKSSQTSGTAIHDGHINAYNTCIELHYRAQIQIHDMLFFNTSGSVDGFTAILEENCVDVFAHDNIFAGPGVVAGQAVGVEFISCTGCGAWNNEIDYFADEPIGFLIGTASTNLTIRDNVAGSNLPNNVVMIDVSSDAGVNNRIYGNAFPQTFTLSVNSATPSVANAQSSSFNTANTLATVITNFLNPTLGQAVELLANDGNTTIQHNSNITLQGGVPFAMGNGAILTLHFRDGIWRETCRRTA